MNAKSKRKKENAIFKLTLLTGKLFFSWNNLFLPWPAPFAKASASGENTVRRTNATSKHTNILVAILLEEIFFFGEEVLRLC